MSLTAAIEIPLSNIRLNPRNGRSPEVELHENYPGISELATSIADIGLERPIQVFELVGHYLHPDEPGNYMILQGHRRFTASKIAGLSHIPCFIVPTPVNSREERKQLWVEQLHSVPWTELQLMRFAYEESIESDLPITDPHIRHFTGLTYKNLERAEKIFKLSPQVFEKLQTYEDKRLRQYMDNNKTRGRLRGNRQDNPEFTIAKAALTYDITAEIMLTFSSIVRERGYDEASLQLRIANSIARYGSSVEQLETFLQQMRNFRGNHDIPLDLHRNVISFIEARENGEDAVRRTGAMTSVRFTRGLNRIRSITSEVRKLSARKDFRNSLDPQSAKELRMILLEIHLDISNIIAEMDKLKRENS